MAGSKTKRTGVFRANFLRSIVTSSSISKSEGNSVVS